MANKYIRRKITADLVATGTTKAYAAKVMGMSERSFYNRLADPDTFTAREIRILRRFCSKETCDLITQ